MKSISGTSGMVRRINRELVLETLRGLPDGASVADLARSTGLSVATCSNLLQGLAAGGEAVLLPSESQGGRPARRYAYNVNHSLAAAVLLRTVETRAEIRYSVRNGNNESLADGKESCPSFSLADLDGLLSRLVKAHPAIKAVALSIPGIVRDGDIEICDIQALTGTNLERRVAAEFGLKAISENDMTFAAIGYHNQNVRDIKAGLAYATFPDGLCPGMGIIVNGVLVKGKSDFAGEVASIPWPEPKGGAKKGGGREALISRMAAIAVSTIAVVNPDVFVMTGELSSPDLHDSVRERCLERIPERHMPRLVFRPDYEEDSFAGMTAMALGSLSEDVRLVERERLWCGADQ